MWSFRKTVSHSHPEARWGTHLGAYNKRLGHFRMNATYMGGPCPEAQYPSLLAFIPFRKEKIKTYGSLCTQCPGEPIHTICYTLHTVTYCQHMGHYTQYEIINRWVDC